VRSGPAGVSAAEAFRRENAELPIRIVTADTAWPYVRPPLSKEFLRGEDHDVGLHPPHWFEARSIDPVERVDTAERAVATRAGRRYGGPVAVTGIEAGAVHLDSGVTVNADLILATGGDRILVDEHMRTSVQNVYAAGDVAFAFNPALAGVTPSARGRWPVRAPPAGQPHGTTCRASGQRSAPRR
jgi:NADPH-dependent 2,4-dienoyl-CoA reductase/sulfur reductase-like enzyme